MNKSVPFLMKLIAVLLILAGFVLPLLSASFSVGWVGDAPAGAMPDFEGTIFEIYVLRINANELTYDNSSQEFELTPVTGTNEFVDAMQDLQQLLKILLFFSLICVLVPMLVHYRKPSKFMSFLLFLATSLVVVLILLLQNIALQALSSSGTLNGDTVSVDNEIVIDTTSYIWRYSATISVEFGVVVLMGATVLSFLSLFMKSEYDDFEDYYFE